MAGIEVLSPPARSARPPAALLRGCLALLGALAAAPAARAQAPGPGPAPAAPAAPAAPGVLGEAPIVAGNAAGARERAMNEAFRQLVDRALADMLAESGGNPAAPAVAALRAGWLQRPKRLIRNYRILEQTEAGGYVRVRLTAELDEVFMRRELERAQGSGGGRPAAAGAVPLVSAGAPEGAAAVVAALRAAGVAVDARAGAPTDEGKLRTLAASSGRGAVLLVTGRAAAEGPVRGTGQQSVECQIGVRVLRAAAGAAAPERAASSRGFGAREPDARGACFAHAVEDLVPALLPDLGGPGASGADARAVTLALDVTEPALVSSVLRALRKGSGISSAELRRVAVGRAEIQVITRLQSAALVGALARELASIATLTPGQDRGDRIEAQVRLLPPPPAPEPAAPAPGAPPPPAAPPGAPAPRPPGAPAPRPPGPPPRTP
jgi:hypothetical protein